jgi:hypothetical protein
MEANMNAKLIVILILLVAGCPIYEAGASSAVSAKLTPEPIEARIRQNRMAELVAATSKCLSAKPKAVRRLPSE